MSNLYHKIPGLFKREEKRPFKIIEGIYREPELELLKDVDWVFTEKVDGTNIRVMWDGHKVTFGGRTDNAQIPSLLVTKLNELFLGNSAEQMFEQVFGESEAIIFGEGYGAKIQKGGGNYSQTQEFVAFDVKIGNSYLRRESVEDICSKFGLRVVPIMLMRLNRGTRGTPTRPSASKSPQLRFQSESNSLDALLDCSD